MCPEEVKTLWSEVVRKHYASNLKRPVIAHIEAFHWVAALHTQLSAKQEQKNKNKNKTVW